MALVRGREVALAPLLSNLVLLAFGHNKVRGGPPGKKGNYLRGSFPDRRVSDEHHCR